MKQQFRSRVWRGRAAMGLLACGVLAGCASVPPVVPRIERLPESASGIPAPARSGAYSLEEVVAMTRQGDPAPVIVQKLRDSRTPFGGLTADQESLLARQGVPADVVVWLRYGDRAPVSGTRSAYRDACLRNPYCRPSFYGPGYPYSPYGFGYPPYRSGLYFGSRFRR